MFTSILQILTVQFVTLQFIFFFKCNANDVIKALFIDLHVYKCDTGFK